MSARKTALVVAPGRGTYGKGELGSIARIHGTLDGTIAYQGGTTVSEFPSAAVSIAVEARASASAAALPVCCARSKNA